MANPSNVGVVFTWRSACRDPYFAGAWSVVNITHEVMNAPVWVNFGPLPIPRIGRCQVFDLDLVSSVDPQLWIRLPTSAIFGRFAEGNKYNDPRKEMDLPQNILSGIPIDEAWSAFYHQVIVTYEADVHAGIHPLCAYHRAVQRFPEPYLI